MRLQESAEFLDRKEQEFHDAVHRGFRDDDGHGEARLSLRQVADTHFRVVDGLSFTRPDGEVVSVAPGDFNLSRTDLTSVPSSLTWFVPKYGRHTPAALVHDALLDRATRDHPNDLDAALLGYERADEVFREALGSLGVPPLRRTLMWAAVCFGTRLRTAGHPRRRIQLWLAAFVSGLTALVVGVVQGNWPLVAVALLGPVPAARLWGRQYRAALVAGAAAVFVAVPTVAVLATSLAYEVLERIVGLLTGDQEPSRGRPRPDTGFEYAPMAMQRRLGSR